MFGYERGGGVEGECTEDSIQIGNRAGDVVRVVMDVWDLFSAASGAPSFSGDEIAGFVASQT